MRSILFTLLLLLSQAAQAQRFGYIDTQLILEKMPAYKEAGKAIEQQTQMWLSEMDRMKQEIDTLRTQLAQDELLLTPEMKAARKQKIEEKQEALRKFQSKHFGYEGLLFVKRQEMVKPLQDKIAKAAAKVARKRRLQFLFDKSSELIMVYSDPRHNYTDFVLEELGLGDPADTPR